jgi:segregation and condensation protein B
VSDETHVDEIARPEGPEGEVLRAEAPPAEADAPSDFSPTARRAADAAAREGALTKTVEALLFLSPEPVSLDDLAEACEVGVEDIDWALAELREACADRGVAPKEVAGGWTLATDPVAEPAARKLLAKPRTPPLSPAQAETLAIVSYLQPVSRPEIARIRGVASDSATATLLERGLIEEHGRSQFGAVLYRTTPLFLKLFGLTGLDELPDPSQWDPTPEEQGELRDRLLRAGEARAGLAAVTSEPSDEPAAEPAVEVPDPVEA